MMIPDDPTSSVADAIEGTTTQVDEDLNSLVPEGVHHGVDQALDMPAVGEVALALEHLPGAIEDGMRAWATATGAGDQPED